MSRRRDREAKKHITPKGDGTYWFDVEAIPNYDAKAEIVVRCQACRYRLLIVGSDVLSVTRSSGDPLWDAWMQNPDPVWFRPMVEINTEGLFGQSWPADELFEQFGKDGMIDDLDCPKCGVTGIRFSWRRHRADLLEMWRDAERHQEPRRVIIDC